MTLECCGTVMLWYCDDTGMLSRVGAAFLFPCSRTASRPALLHLPTTHPPRPAPSAGGGARVRAGDRAGPRGAVLRGPFALPPLLAALPHRRHAGPRGAPAQHLPRPPETPAGVRPSRPCPAVLPSLLCLQASALAFILVYLIFAIKTWGKKTDPPALPASAGACPVSPLLPVPHTCLDLPGVRMPPSARPILPRLHVRILLLVVEELYWKSRLTGHTLST